MNPESRRNRHSLSVRRLKDCRDRGRDSLEVILEVPVGRFDPRRIEDRNARVENSPDVVQACFEDVVPRDELREGHANRLQNFRGLVGGKGRKGHFGLDVQNLRTPQPGVGMPVCPAWATPARAVATSRWPLAGIATMMMSTSETASLRFVVAISR